MNDPRTERIRRYVDACNENHLAVQLAPADLAYVLGRIEALEGETERLQDDAATEHFARELASDEAATLELRYRAVVDAARALQVGMDKRDPTVMAHAGIRMTAALAALDGQS